MELIIFIAVITVLITIPIIKVNSLGTKYIVDTLDLKDDNDKVIILGAGIGVDGQPCDLLKDRISVAIDIYLKGYAEKILITGDNYSEEYNEVATMESWIINNCFYVECIHDDILLDNNGFSTLDSIYRAKEVFKAKKIIISTNRYHLPRAIYIARCLGIEAYGVQSDLRVYDRLNKYKRREILAQIKDFYFVNYIKNRLQ